MLFLLGMLWFVYAVLSITSEEAASENLDYIPENATLVYRIDGRTFLKQALTTMLLHEDQDLSEMIRELSKNATSDNLKPLGISFESEIAYFQVNEDSSVLTGFLFNLNNPRVFKKNIRDFVSDNVAISCQHNVGLILVGDPSLISQKRLQSKADGYLGRKSNFATRNKINSENSVFTVWNKSTDGTNTTFSATVNGQQFNFTGELKLRNKMVTQDNVLAPDGIHISTAIVPSFVSGFIRSTLKVNSSEMPDISSISMNYYGMKFISDPEFFMAPEINMWINFTDTVSLDSVFKNFNLGPPQPKLAFRILEVYGESYIVQKKGKSSIGIFSGSQLDKHSKTLETDFSYQAFRITGDPKYLFHIEGDGLIKQLLNLSPSIQASRKLVAQIKELDITAKPYKNDTYKIEGYIELKKGEFPLNALFKFLIQSKLLQ